MALPLNLLLLMRLCVNKALVMPLLGPTANVVCHSCLAHFQKWHMSFHRSWDALPGALSYSLVLSGRMYLEPAWPPLTKTNTSPSLIAASSLHKALERVGLCSSEMETDFGACRWCKMLPRRFQAALLWTGAVSHVTSGLSSISSWKTLNFHLILLCRSSQCGVSSIFLWRKCFGVGAMKIWCRCQ